MTGLRGLLRLAAAGAIAGLLAWVRSRMSKKTLEDALAADKATVAAAPSAPAAPAVALAAASAAAPASAKHSSEVTDEKKQGSRAERRERDRYPERLKRKDMTDEQKEEERLRRQQESEIKFGRKREGAEALLVKIRDRFSESCHAAPVVLAALDVEAWEQDGKKVTEIGMAIAKLTFFDTAPTEALASEVVFRHRHVLLREHLELHNGKHVEDNKDRFLFGNSEVLSLADAAMEVATELNSADFIVGHAVSGDLAWLRDIGVDGIEANSKSLQARVVDTQTLAFASAGISVGSQPVLGLKAMATSFGLDPQCLHNGANDAAFTLQVMLMQCGVSFSLPKRSMSQHKASAEFQSAWVEALARLDDTQLSWVQREQDLRTQVAEFAERLRVHDLGKEGDDDEADTREPLVLCFPSDLNGTERRCVHQAAEELGLQSHSTSAGPSGERCVSIFKGGDQPNEYKQSWQSRPGKKPKMKRSQLKQHRKTLEQSSQQASPLEQRLPNAAASANL